MAGHGDIILNDYTNVSASVGCLCQDNTVKLLSDNQFEVTGRQCLATMDQASTRLLLIAAHPEHNGSLFVAGCS